MTLQRVIVEHVIYYYLSAQLANLINAIVEI